MWVPLLVFAGGGAGALLRWSLGLILPGWVGVVVANIVGSFILGALANSPLRDQAPAMAFLGAGMMGGFTTYSTFNLNLLEAANRGAWGELALQFTTTAVVCFGAGALGLWVGGQIPR